MYMYILYGNCLTNIDVFSHYYNNIWEEGVGGGYRLMINLWFFSKNYSTHPKFLKIIKKKFEHLGFRHLKNTLQLY